MPIPDMLDSIQSSWGDIFKNIQPPKATGASGGIGNIQANVDMPGGFRPPSGSFDRAANVDFPEMKAPSYRGIEGNSSVAGIKPMQNPQYHGLNAYPTFGIKGAPPTGAFVKTLGGIAHALAPKSWGGRLGKEMAGQVAEEEAMATSREDKRLAELFRQDRLRETQKRDEDTARHRRVLEGQGDFRLGAMVDAKQAEADRKAREEEAKRVGGVSLETLRTVPSESLELPTEGGSTIRKELEGQVMESAASSPGLQHMFKAYEDRQYPIVKEKTPQRITETDWIAKAAQGDPEAKKVVGAIEAHKRATKDPRRDRFVTARNKDGDLVLVDIDNPGANPKVIEGVKKDAPKKGKEEGGWRKKKDFSKKWGEEDKKMIQQEDDDIRKALGLK